MDIDQPLPLTGDMADLDGRAAAIMRNEPDMRAELGTRSDPRARRSEPVRRSPAEAAAAAAQAALGSDTIAEKGAGTAARNRCSADWRAPSGARRQADMPPLAGSAPNVDMPSVDLDEPLDPKLANRPLEPGSGAPDLNAIMKRVRDERGQPARHSDGDAAKSDFIAAARRAAQAAAAEADALKRQSDHEGPGEGAADRRPAQGAAQADPDGGDRDHAGACRPAAGQGLLRRSGRGRKQRYGADRRLAAGRDRLGQRCQPAEGRRAGGRAGRAGPRSSGRQSPRSRQPATTRPHDMRSSVAEPEVPAVEARASADGFWPIRPRRRTQCCRRPPLRNRRAADAQPAAAAMRHRRSATTASDTTGAVPPADAAATPVVGQDRHSGRCRPAALARRGRRRRRQGAVRDRFALRRIARRQGRHGGSRQMVREVGRTRLRAGANTASAISTRRASASRATSRRRRPGTSSPPSRATPAPCTIWPCCSPWPRTA